MLQQAWLAISTDPLVDSDDEMGGDEYVRDDYVQRLDVINRLSRRRWAHEAPPFSPLMDTDPI
jgi:Ino eighty subunit 1